MCAALFGLMAVCSTMVLPSPDGAAATRVLGEPRAQKRGPVQEAIQVAVRRGLDARQALDRSDRGGQLLRDRARRLSQAPRELECDRQRQIAQRAVRRVVDDDGRHVAGRQAELGREHGVQACAEDVVNRENHRVVV